MLSTKSSFTAHLLILFFGGLLLTHHCVQGQASKVSSKLDFDESDGSNNQTSLSGQSGAGNGSYDPGTGRNLGGGGGGGGSSGGGTTTTSGSGTSSGGNRPKIHGVRVTVDTGDGQQQTKESKESVEITDLGKHKKRVGIHTDITFEITSDSDGNETSSAQQQGDKEDASVPIYKGRGGSDSKHKARKPYDPKSQWNPNFSGEQRGYQGSSNRGGYQGSNRGEYYPQYYPQNVYTGGNSDAGSIYRNGETWTHYVPVWTTERVPQEQGQIYRRPSWKPCYCMSSADFRRRRDSKAGRDPVDHHKGVINSGVVQVVDGKLETPFS
ncbi:hyphally regulated cell wall protein 1 [Drosophila subpulchrella]|uniref:hyphally regulated cell wall protein 1 n=1 Tax=Drosophila subpulchrella TaxID=1486046 RepID=UPI0018A17547|nr:hyphally regulated cell wall protein 1 [Drosophila subpulchrella]